MNGKKRFAARLLITGLLSAVLLSACAPAAALPVAVAATELTAMRAGGTLSEVEASGLQFMREEEKLAHDVYVTLYAQWGLPVFQNISGAEQTHTTAIKTLLDRYHVADPALNQPVGRFANAQLQALYNQLIASGTQSLEAALRVGAAVEEIDILDLQQRIAQTNRTDIRNVYTNLINGSYNHLRAFVSNLQQQLGVIYTPQYLTQEAYDQIMSTGTRGGPRW